MNTKEFNLCSVGDLHLDHFADPNLGFDQWVKAFKGQNPSAILLTGDIGTGLTTPIWLEKFATAFPNIFIYFVLGNHDFYGSSFAQVKYQIREKCEKYPNLIYLPDRISYATQLTPSVGIVGVDGWGDGVSGAGDQSTFKISDWKLIDDFKRITDPEKWKLMRDLSERAATELDHQLKDGVNCFMNLVVAIHVPPWPQCCFYEGKPSNPDDLPFFTCSPVGKMIKAYALANERRFEVLTGHTHSEARVIISDKITTHICGAEYGKVGKIHTISFPLS